MDLETQRFPTSGDVRVAVGLRHERDKESAGGAACTVWIIIGFYLFWTVSGARFFSWQAAVYFIPGIFFAALVFGGTSYLIAWGLEILCTRFPRKISRPLFGLGSLVILFVEWALMFIAARSILAMLLNAGKGA